MTWDDASIPDADVLYRRVPLKPDFFVHSDLLDGTKRLSRASFQFDDDGISVYRDSVLRIHGLTPASVCKNEHQCVYSFTAGAARKAGVGVVENPDMDDLPRGYAHALLVCPVMPPDRPTRQSVQNALCAVAERVAL